MPNLKIKLNANLIEIEPVGQIENEDWALVVNAWSKDYVNDINKKILYINIAEFAYRANWLRTNWTSISNNYKIEPIDEDTKNAIINTKNYLQEFIDLSNTDEKPEQINFENLGLKRELRPFQKENVNALLRMRHGANFSVPGAGKTATSLVVWEYLKRTQNVNKLLIICPKSSFEAWETEPAIILKDNNPTQQLTDEPIKSITNILYVNYEQLENNEKTKRLVNWVKKNKTNLIIDEAHRIKSGPSSVRWNACNEISKNSFRVDILTGTPMPQSIEDLKNLYSLSWKEISREYFNLSVLQSIKRNGVFVRTTKKELALPPMPSKYIELQMGPLQKQIYAALKNNYAGQFGVTREDQGYFSARGKAVMTLIAAATNPGLLLRTIKEDAYLGLTWPPKDINGSEMLIDLLSNYSKHEMPSKYKYVAEKVNKLVKLNKKIIIWSSFVGNLLALYKLLLPYKPALIYGSVKDEDRKNELKRFRNSDECMVLLSNPQTLGEGVSLHMICHEAIYLDRTYNAGLYLQSLDRIHRLGLPSYQETNVYILQNETTIDRRIALRLENKIYSLGVALDDSNLVQVSLPNGDGDDTEEEIIGLDENDLNDLYQHLRVNND